MQNIQVEILRNQHVTSNICKITVIYYNIHDLCYKVYTISLLYKGTFMSGYSDE